MIIKLLYYILLITSSFGLNNNCFKPNNSTYISLYNNKCDWVCNPGFNKINNSCIVKSSIKEPYSVYPSGFEILQIYYNISCLLHGCWVINFAYTENSKANSVLYLPNNKFDNNFPCNNNNLSSISSSSCCLIDFINNYHYISSFNLPYNNTCDINNPPLLYNNDNIYGKFTNMPISLVQNFINTDSSIVKTGQILLDNNELINSKACIFTGTLGIFEQYDLFVGLAEFIPTNTKILLTSSKQNKLLLTKSDYLTFSTFGNNIYTFLNFINININRINVENILYVSVFFIIDKNYLFNELPLSSIIIGYNNANYYNPCNSPLLTNYLSLLSQSCQPNIKICIFDIKDNFVKINLPLLNYDYQNININLVVSALDISNNNIVQNTLNSEIIYISSGVIDWCLIKKSYIDIKSYLQSINLIVGIGGNLNDFNNLNKYNILQNNNSIINSLNSKSIESGLITFILKGDDSYFNLLGNIDYSLDLRDVITLHITGNSKFNQVMNLLNNTEQFNITNINNYPSLIPSSSLTEICNSISNPFPQTSCVLRYDIKSNVLSSTAFQINNNIDSKSFIQSIFNYDNDYIYELGNNFSSLIINNYGLIQNTNKYRKAFWINPAFNWIGAGINGEDRFTLSQWIITVALININQNSSSRRLLVTNTYNNNLFNIKYGIDPVYILALNLNIPLEYSSSWMMQMLLNNIQITLPEQALILDIQSILYKYVSECSSPILKLGIVSIDFDKNIRRFDNTVIASIEFILGFNNNTIPYLNIDKFLKNPNVLSIKPIIKSSIINIDNINVIDNNINIIIITTTICSFILLMLIIDLYYYVYHKKNTNIVNNNIECSIFFPTPDVEWKNIEVSEKQTPWLLKI